MAIRGEHLRSTTVHGVCEPPIGFGYSVGCAGGEPLVQHQRPLSPALGSSLVQLADGIVAPRVGHVAPTALFTEKNAGTPGGGGLHFQNK